MNFLRSTHRRILPVIIGFGLLSGCTGCNDPTPPRADPMLLGLNIFLYQHPQEANVNENVYLGGRLNDRQGVAQGNARVTFSLEPDSVGDVTAFAVTNPDSATGFETRVTFIGRRPGVALITGQVLEGQEVLGRDTVRIRVRDPINGLHPGSDFLPH